MKNSREEKKMENQAVEKDNEVILDNRDEKLGEGVGFERIRRITGYLVGTMDKWNDAKRAEERDRVKHSLAENA
jgi:ribonucleoside-triphosphate reductase